MSLLVRKISHSKWKSNNSHDIESIPADTIIGELNTLSKTSSDIDISERNTLSFWLIENETNLNDAVLALLTAPKVEVPERIDIIWADKNCFEHYGLTVRNTPGETAIDDLVSNHINVCDMTYFSLGIISKIILESIERNQFCRFNKNKINNLLTKAFDDNRINKTKCNPKLLSRFDKA